MPDTPSSSPTMVFRRQRGWRNSSTGEPMLVGLRRSAAASAFARSHDSGSLSTNMIGTMSSEGTMPTKKSTRQPL